MSAPEPPEAGSPGPPAKEQEAGPADKPPTPAPPAAVEDRPSTWQPGLYIRLTLLLLAVAYAIAFVAKNTRDIPIDFVFGKTSVSLIWEILLLLAVGIVGGVLLSQLYRHRRRAMLAKQSRQGRDAVGDHRRRNEAERKPR